MRTIRAVTQYPGSPLYDLAIKKDLIKDIEDLYLKKDSSFRGFRQT